MTWKTSSGIKIITPLGDSGRILQGKEAVLFALTIINIIDSYNKDNIKHNDSFEDISNSIKGPFSKLLNPQKFTVLEDVAIGLLITSDSCPELYALNESAIYFIYQWIIKQFKDDIQLAKDQWGQLVIDAYEECYPSINKDIEYDLNRPRIDYEDKSIWIVAIETLADRILWDRDCNIENLPPSSNNCTFVKDYYKSSSDYIENSRLGSKERLYELCNKIVHLHTTTSDKSLLPQPIDGSFTCSILPSTELSTGNLNGFISPINLNNNIDNEDNMISSLTTSSLDTVPTNINNNNKLTNINKIDHMIFTSETKCSKQIQKERNNSNKYIRKKKIYGKMPEKQGMLLAFMINEMIIEDNLNESRLNKLLKTSNDFKNIKNKRTQFFHSLEDTLDYLLINSSKLDNLNRLSKSIIHIIYSDIVMETILINDDTIIEQQTKCKRIDLYLSYIKNAYEEYITLNNNYDLDTTIKDSKLNILEDANNISLSIWRNIMKELADNTISFIEYVEKDPKSHRNSKKKIVDLCQKILNIHIDSFHNHSIINSKVEETVVVVSYSESNSELCNDGDDVEAVNNNDDNNNYYDDPSNKSANNNSNDDDNSDDISLDSSTTINTKIDCLGIHSNEVNDNIYNQFNHYKQQDDDDNNDNIYDDPFDYNYDDDEGDEDDDDNESIMIINNINDNIKTNEQVLIQTTNIQKSIMKPYQTALFLFTIQRLILQYCVDKEVFIKELKKKKFSKDIKKKFFIILNTNIIYYLIKDSSFVKGLDSTTIPIITFIYDWISRQFNDDIILAKGLWGKKIIDAYYECYPSMVNNSINSNTRLNINSRGKSIWIDAIEVLSKQTCNLIPNIAYQQHFSRGYYRPPWCSISRLYYDCLEFLSSMDLDSNDNDMNNSWTIYNTNKLQNTWNNTKEQSILQGKHAILFASILQHIIDQDHIDENILKNILRKDVILPYSNIKIFNIFYDIANHLMILSPYTELFNYIELYGITFIYQWIIKQFKDDIQLAKDQWGQLIIDAYEECYPSIHKDIEYDLNRPRIDYEDESIWIVAIETLANHIIIKSQKMKNLIKMKLNNTNDDMNITSYIEDEIAILNNSKRSKKKKNLKYKRDPKFMLSEICNTICGTKIIHNQPVEDLISINSSIQDLTIKEPINELSKNENNNIDIINNSIETNKLSITNIDMNKVVLTDEIVIVHNNDNNSANSNNNNTNNNSIEEIIEKELNLKINLIEMETKKMIQQSEDYLLIIENLPVFINIYCTRDAKFSPILIKKQFQEMGLKYPISVHALFQILEKIRKN